MSLPDPSPSGRHVRVAFLGALPRRGVILAGVVLGIFLSAVEATVVGTVLPSIAASLKGLALYGWVATAYLAASTASVPVWGRLADLHGRRLFYLIGIGLFLLGSILSGAVPEPAPGETTMGWLIAARALQGLGAGAIMPIGLTMIGDIFELHERARVQGWLSSVWGIASVVGPLVGGVIAEKLSWRWVFYLNVPFGLVGALLVGIAWREEPKKSHERLRVLPALLMVSSVVLAITALAGASPTAGLPWLRPAAATLAVVTGVTFVLVERRSATPLLDLSLFQNRMFRAVAIGGVFSGIGMFTALTFAPLHMQGILGEPPAEAGKVLGWLMFVWMAGSIVSPRIAIKYGFRPVAMIGAVFITVGYALFLAASLKAAPYPYVAACMATIGAGCGLTIAPLLIAVQSSVETRQRGSATSLTQFARSLGGTFGVAAIGGILAVGLTSGVTRIAAEKGLDPAKAAALVREVDQVVHGDTHLDGVEQAVLREALQISLAEAFAIATGASFLFLLSTFFVPRETLARPAVPPGEAMP